MQHIVSFHILDTVPARLPACFVRLPAQVLPGLMALIIESLAQPEEDRQQAAARCLGELVRKMGERVLARIIPILRDGIGSDATATRQGVCLGMREVLDNLTRSQLQDHLSDILPTVQVRMRACVHVCMCV